MDYTTEDKEDKKYKGKGYTRKEFKKDVGEAVVEAQKGETKKTAKKPKRKYTKKNQYANMTAGELRKLLQDLQDYDRATKDGMWVWAPHPACGGATPWC